MSFLIKGMEMPKGCWDCDFAVKTFGRTDFYCAVLKKGISLSKTEREKDCSLVPVPPHGRLIDADKIFLNDFEIVMCNGDYKEALRMQIKKILDAPTVIEKEGKEE